MFFFLTLGCMVTWAFLLSAVMGSVGVGQKPLATKQEFRYSVVEGCFQQDDHDTDADSFDYVCYITEPVLLDKSETDLW